MSRLIVFLLVIEGYKQKSPPTDCWLDEDVGSDHSKWGISLPKAPPNIRWTFQNIFFHHFSWKDLLPFSTWGLPSFLHSDVCQLHFPGCPFFGMKMVGLPEGTNFQDFGLDGPIFKDSRLPAKGQLTITVFWMGKTYDLTRTRRYGIFVSFEGNQSRNYSEFRWLKYNLSSKVLKESNMKHFGPYFPANCKTKGYLFRVLNTLSWK